MPRRTQVTLLVFLALVGVAILSLASLEWQTDYDDEHPDYARYAGKLAEARAALNQPGADADMDFADLQGGAWQTVCLFGGGSNPRLGLQQLGATMSDFDFARLGDLGSGFFFRGRLTKEEAMIATLDAGRHAEVIHFEHGLGPAGEGFRKCIEKPDTVMPLTAP